MAISRLEPGWKPVNYEAWPIELLCCAVGLYLPLVGPFSPLGKARGTKSSWEAVDSSVNSIMQSASKFSKNVHAAFGIPVKSLFE